MDTELRTARGARLCREPARLVSGLPEGERLCLFEVSTPNFAGVQHLPGELWFLAQKMAHFQC